jgi:hypothetical protein
MPDTTTNEVAVLTVTLTPAELAALAAAARRAEMPLARLAQLFIAYCLTQLETGDAGLERAVKGSRDASLR